MKQTTLFFFKMLTITLVIVNSLSCEGPEGPTGENGLNGTNGLDGNANVDIYTFETPDWGVASGMTLSMNNILTDEVIENSAVVIYLNTNSGAFDNTLLIPGVVLGNGGAMRHYQVFLWGTSDVIQEAIGIVSLEMDGSYTPNIDLWPVNWVKVFIVHGDTATRTASSTNPLNQLLHQLEAQGYDINNYQDFCDYFNIQP